MNIWESVRIALRGLSSNKMRAFLTMLGIIIGVGAVIALLSVGQGVQASVTSQITSTGSNLITVTPGGSSSSNSRVAAFGQQNATLTSSDAQAVINAALPDVAAVSPELSAGGQIQFGSQTSFGSIMGVTPDYLTVHNADVPDGDFISQANIDSVSTVVVLGSSLASSLFGDQEPVGQTVNINRAGYRVIGVMAPKGGSSFGSVDSTAFVPISSAQKRLIGGNRGVGTGLRVSDISISAVNQNQVNAAITEVTGVLETAHNIQNGQDDFTVISQAQILGALDQVTGILTAFLGAIAGISLLVGGIGIMNIMLVSVTERTREIGIRKAVGATSHHIMVQFLVEALIITTLGGLLGIGLGVGMAGMLGKALGRVGWHRHLLWSLPCQQGRPPPPHRRPAVRIEVRSQKNGLARPLQIRAVAAILTSDF
jgi:putative ABC transport system permease protein